MIVCGAAGMLNTNLKIMEIMKKLILGAAAMTLVMMAACSGNPGSGMPGKYKDEVYTGVIPAADAAGVRYTLKLDYSDDHNYTDGDYDLVEVYLAGDSLSSTGYKDAARFKSEGDFTVIDGTGANSSRKYLKLVQDARDSSAGSNAGPIYFLVESDSTIVMVNADLEPSATPGMNYTLKLVR